MQQDHNLVAQVTAFLNLESDLLDHKDYQDWLSLWEPEGLYVIPVDHSVTDYKNHLNIAYDDQEMRQARVERLSGGEAVSTQISQNTVRTLSRVRIMAQDGDVIDVRAAYCLYENNKNGVRIFPANLTFKLKQNANGFTLLEKVVRIMKSDEHLSTISYLF